MRKRLPSRPDNGSDWERQLGQVELVLGSMGMVIGGFALRVTDYYEIVLVSSVIAVLGIIHVWRGRDRSPSLSLEAERLHLRLDSRLSADYIYVPGEVGPELVADGWARDWIVGPWGIGVVCRLDRRGEFQGHAGDPSWEWTPVDGETGQPIDNPLIGNRELISGFRTFLDTAGEDPSAVPTHSVVVLMKNHITGTIDELDSVCSLGDLPGWVESRERGDVPEDLRSDWEDLLGRFLRESRTSMANVGG